MDETALSSSILQFVGAQGLSVSAPETTCTVSVPANGVLDVPIGDPIDQSSSGEGSKVSVGASGGIAPGGSTVASSQQQEGLMRTLMGNKV